MVIISNSVHNIQHNLFLIIYDSNLKLIQQLLFVNILYNLTFQENKVIILDELALKFKLKTQVAIDRIQSLLEQGSLTGNFLKFYL